MSRNIDMTKPMNEWDPDDVRYALDYNMLDDETAIKAKTWLDGLDGKEPDAAAPDENAYDPGEFHVDEVVEHLGTVDADEFARIIAAERSGKNRKSIVSMDPQAAESED